MKAKKLCWYVAALLLIGLPSCEDLDSVYLHDLFVEKQVEYTLNISINNTSLVSSLIDPYDDLPYFIGGEVASGYFVRTKLFIYDSNGDLWGSSTDYNSSFNTLVEKQATMSPDDYTVVTIVDITSDTLDTYWQVLEESTLNTLHTSTSIWGQDSYGILAYSIKTASLSDANASISMSPSHLGALYSIFFSNVNYNSIKNIYYSVNIDPDSFSPDSRQYSRLLNRYQYNNLPFTGTYTGYYTTAYLLPKSSGLTFSYILEDAYQNQIGSTRSITLYPYANQHKLLTIDVTANTTSTTVLGPRLLNAPIGNANTDKSNRTSVYFNSNDHKARISTQSEIVR